MWDVLVTLILMSAGALIFIVVTALFGWSLLWMQNGCDDE
jgi:hypothetical protein